MCIARALPLVFAFALAACSGVEEPNDGPNDLELITTVELTLVSDGGGPGIVASWSDPENDGDPVIDTLDLTVGDVYTVTVAFINDLEDPPEDISVEVADEAEEHQVFFTGPGVVGPASNVVGALVTHAYDDSDSLGQPLGLQNMWTVEGAGQGDITVTLRHLPEQDGMAVKTPDLASEVAEGGFEAIGGDNDAQVTFPVSVQQ